MLGLLFFVFEFQVASCFLGGPFYQQWFFLAFEHIRLVHHGLPCKFCVVAVCVLDDDLVASILRLLADVNVFDFSPWTEHRVHSSGCLLDWILGSVVQLKPLEEDCLALLIEAADSSEVLLIRGMPCPAEDVSKVVLLFHAIVVVWRPMVKPAVFALSTTSSCEINTEPSTACLLECIGLCEARLCLWVAPVECWRPFDCFFLHVSEVLVVPDVVFIVSFEVSDFSLRAIDHLFNCRPLEPSLSVLLHLHSEILGLLHFIITKRLSGLFSNLAHLLVVGLVNQF